MSRRRRAHDKAVRKAWLDQAMRWPAEPWPGDAGAVMGKHNDSVVGQFTPKVGGDHPDYKWRVAVPTMAAVDALPKPYRLLVHVYGYVGVYLAWRRGWAASRISEMAERMGGRFVL